MTRIKAALAQCAMIIAAVVLLLATPASAVRAAATLQITPSTATVAQGENITPTVTVNTDNADSFGTDAVLLYPKSAFDFVSATAGSFYPDNSSSHDANAGILTLHGFVSTTFQYKKGTGTLATVVLKAKTGTGTSTVSFICGTGSQTSQIISDSGTNILSCNNINQSVISLTGSSAGNTPTPTPTPLPGAPTATPTGNPGNREPVCTGLSLSHSSATRPVTVTLVCSGSDADNDITAAEFSFGNGSSRVVERNVGQHGSLSTTYTYSAAGTYLTSCRIMDNNGRYSSVPANCQKALIVSNARPTATPAFGSNRTGTRTPTPIVMTGATPRPTAMLTLAPYKTPTPTIEAPETTPAPQSAREAFFTGDKFRRLITMLLISVATIAVAFFVLRYFDRH